MNALAPLRLMLFDRSCTGRLQLGLTDSWRVGGALFRSLNRFDGCFGAASWDEGLRWLASHQAGRQISEIQYWGHGRAGQLLIDREVLDVGALEEGHGLQPLLGAIRDRLVGPEALLWLRTCSTFGTAKGHDFALRWTRFFNCRVAGHTHVIGPVQGGLHTLRPGEAPRWPVEEGAQPAGKGALPQWLWLRAPNAVSFLTWKIPDGF